MEGRYIRRVDIHSIHRITVLVHWRKIYQGFIKEGEEPPPNEFSESIEAVDLEKLNQDEKATLWRIISKAMTRKYEQLNTPMDY